MMRLLILPFAAWMGLLSLAAPAPAASDFPQLFATAGVLGSLTVLVYRLGIWRQEMENTRSNVGAEVRSYREESTQNFARMERKLESLDHMITDYNDFKQKAARWRHRSERRLDRLEEKP
jgi:hypothetical protein